MHVTFLGPYGATFSHDAYNLLSRRYGAPTATVSNYVAAQHNADVLPLVLAHGGYGTIAMETVAEGRNTEPMESFIELLPKYPNQSQCPVTVIGAVRMHVHFHLMARPDVSLGAVEQVLAHPKALGACRHNVAKLGVRTTDAASNGEAARLLAQTGEYARSAALGPRSAAEQFGLHILHDAFEDQEAITTFFLIGPSKDRVHVGKRNRVLMVFEVAHRPNALVRSLSVLGEVGLNLIQVYSMHAGQRTYHFLAEAEVADTQVPMFSEVVGAFTETTSKCLVFGPFEVFSR